MKKLLLIALCAFAANAAAQEEYQNVDEHTLVPAEDAEQFLQDEYQTLDAGNDLSLLQNSVVICYARNGRGQTFSARANRPVVAQRQAIFKCQRRTPARIDVCYASGCQRLR